MENQVSSNSNKSAAIALIIMGMIMLGALSFFWVSIQKEAINNKVYNACRVEVEQDYEKIELCQENWIGKDDVVVILTPVNVCGKYSIKVPLQLEKSLYDLKQRGFKVEMVIPANFDNDVYWLVYVTKQ